MLFRPRLVIPTEDAGRWAGRAEFEISPSGRLAFGSLVVDEDGIDRVLDEMTAASAAWLTRHPEAPPVLSRLRYEREPKGENDYLHVAVSLGYYDDEYHPYRDCEDVEIAVSSEARARRGLLRARPVKRRVGARLWHIVTDFGDGREQDTTALLLRRQGQAPWIS